MKNVAEIVERLKEFSDISSLPEKDKKKFYLILQKFCQNKKVTGLDIKKILDSEESSPRLVGYRYILAAIQWMDDRGVVKRVTKKPLVLEVTDKSHMALRTLEELLYPPKIEPIEIGLIGDGKISITFDRAEFDAVEKLDFIFSPKVYGPIKDVLNEVVDYVGSSKMTVEFSLKPSPIVKLLSYMTKVYSRYTEEHLFPFSFQIDNEIRSSGIEIRDLSKEKLWQIIWDFYERHAVNEISNGKNLNIDAYLPKILDFESGKLNTLSDYLREAEVKNFIRGMLKRNPNFFMPYFFWEKIGFKIRMCPLEDTVAPPTSDYYFARNDFPHILVSLREVLDEATCILEAKGIAFESEEERKKFYDSIEYDKIHRIYDRLHSWFHPSSWFPPMEVDRTEEFYKAWAVLRKKYLNILFDVSQIFDAAYEQYIISNHKPNVDLVKVFSDLAHKLYGEKEAVDMIKEGKNPLPPPGRRRPYKPLE